MSDDEKVSFSTSDPFAASSASEPEPTPEPEPVAEVVATPEADPMLAPEPVNEPAPVVAQPEKEPEKAAEPPLAEFPEIPPPTEEQIATELAQQKLQEVERRETERQRAEDAKRYQDEQAILNWAQRVKTDVDFATAEMDRLGLPQYLDILAEAKVIPVQREAAAREARQKELLASHDQMVANIKAQHEAKIATTHAYAYGKSLGLDEKKIADVFAKNDNWDGLKTIKAKWEACRNALHFEATTSGVPEAAKTVVAAEDIARRKVAQGGAPGGSPEPRKKSAHEEWSDNMAKAISGEPNNIFT